MTYRRRETTTEEHPHPHDEGLYTSHTVYDPYAGRRLTLHRWTQAIYLVFGVIETLIAIRFALRLLGANPAAAFTDFIYDVTAPFIAPFVGVFGTPEVDGAVLEPHSLLAIAVYALIAWLAVRLLWVVAGESGSAVVRDTVSDDTGYHHG